MTPFVTLMLFAVWANVIAGLAFIFLWGHELIGCGLVANGLLSCALAWWCWGDMEKL